MSRRSAKRLPQNLFDEDVPQAKNKRDGSRRSTQNSQKSVRGSRKTSTQTPKQRRSSQQSQRNTQSQSSITEFLEADSSKKGSVPEADILELARSTVYYALAVSSSKLPVARTDLIKTILAHHNARIYPDVIDKAAEVMQEIFGLTMMPADEKPLNKSDKLLVVNPLGNKCCTAITAADDDEQGHQVLLLLLLSGILMAGGQIEEGELINFLGELEVGHQATNDPAFGNIPARINMYKSQLYLKYEKDKSLDPPVTTVEWGPRAHAEVSKKEIFRFAQQLYPDLRLSDFAKLTISPFEQDDEEEEEKESEDEDKDDSEEDDSDDSDEDMSSDDDDNSAEK